MFEQMFLRIRIQLSNGKNRLALIIVAGVLFLVFILSRSNSSISASKTGDAGIFTMSPCHTDEEARAIQMRHLKPDALHKPECDSVGLCSCKNGFYFNGQECLEIAGSPWESMFQTLKKKWHEVPSIKEEYKGVDVVQAGKDRAFTEDILKLNDDELVRYWKYRAPKDTFTMFYASTFTGKRVLDIGSGMARQTLQFAMHGAFVTYCDVVPTNLKVIRRVADALGFGKRVHTILIESLDNFAADLEKHSLSEQFMPLDAITAFGSMHHAPREFIHREIGILLKYLKPGGKWLQLAYPINRWTSEQSPPFSVGGWGGDDGVEKTPWAEWYEPGKVVKNMEEHAKMHVNWCGIINKYEFIWLELSRMG